MATGVVRGSGSAGADVSGALGWNSVAPSVVQIRCVSVAGGTTRLGSGFAVGDGRHIVTNEHVVHDDQGRPCIRIRAYVGGTFEEAPEKFLPVSIVRSSEKHDLALLTTDPDIDPLPTVTIATEPLQAGETLIALGYPSIGGDTMTLTTGRYSGTQQRDGVTWIKTDAPIAPGSSGPVFNDRREVVGVSTLLRLAIQGQIGTIGSLSLLATTEDLQALLDGDIGE